MAKVSSPIIGIDIGFKTSKAVVFNKDKTGASLLDYAETKTVDILNTISTLLKTLNCKPKIACVTTSTNEGVVKIIEQPETEPIMLREAIRLNGLALINQDCKKFVVDCSVLKTITNDSNKKYAVSLMPRDLVAQYKEAFEHSRLNINSLMLAPLANLNAFISQQSDEENFIIVDIGANNTNVVLSSRGDVLVRPIQFGGQTALETIQETEAIDEETFIKSLHSDDEIVESVYKILTPLWSQTAKTLNYIETICEKHVDRIFFTGGLGCSEKLLNVLTEHFKRSCRPLSFASVSKPEFEVISPKYSNAIGSIAHLLV